MAMKIGSDSEEDIVAEINITPLTDIFLVLLIIFMISSSAIMESGMQVKLPTAKTSTQTSSTSNKPTVITISKTGSVLVNDKPVADDKLEEGLRASLAQSSEKTVIIRGDESIVLGKAVRIMDSARAAGAEKIALATQQPN